MRTDQPADVIADRYELHSELGRGGSGVVWRAVDRLLRRTVAIKAVDLSLSLHERDPGTARTRVLREARAAAKLSHPSVTAVYDVLDEGDVVYIVMEHVEAPTLTELVRRSGPRPPAHAARVGLDVLGALEVAHRSGIVHRDVKPGNVMVADDGPAKLTDFGIASLADESGVTMTGTLVGSPPFMAPEQATGAEVTPATDLWGLGATLYFAVEGVPPFDRGQALATLNAVVHDDHRPFERAGSLAPAIAALLAKDPADRPPIEQVRRMLEDIASDGAAAAPTEVIEGTDRLDAPPPPRRPAPVPVTETHPSRRWAVGVLGALALIALLAWTLLDQLPDAAPPPPEAPEGVEEPVEEPDEPAAEDPPAGEPEPEPEPEAEDGPGGGPPGDRGAPDEPGEQERGASQAAPEGWTTFEIGPAGATVAHPEEWTVQRRGQTLTDLRDPTAPATYLRTDWTDQPKDDPVADWRRQSATFAERHDGYEEIRIEPLEVDGHDAAIWEYRYTADGLQLRAINVGITTGDHGYALNYQTTEDRWDDTGELREQILASFRT